MTLLTMIFNIGILCNYCIPFIYPQSLYEEFSHVAVADVELLFAQKEDICNMIMKVCHKVGKCTWKLVPLPKLDICIIFEWVVVKSMKNRVGAEQHYAQYKIAQKIDRML